MKDENLHPSIEERLLDYLLGEADGEERQAVERWRREEPAHEEVYRRMRRDLLLIRWGAREERLDAEGRKRALLRRLRAHRSRQLHRVQWAAAVVALFLVGGAVYWLWPSHQDEQPLAAATQVIKPGSPRATLVLSTGEQIDLTRTTGDSIREEDGSLLTVNENRQITYDTARQAAKEEVIYNKIMVPRGGEFTLALADGTMIWLNAESELEYPVKFVGDSREVRLKGEAYFSVRRDTARPFLVSVGDYRLRVYGTEFNLNAYHEDRVEAVLVNGAVGFRANASAPERRLGPNQLATANVFTGEVSVRTVNVYPYIAWKNRDLVFDNEPLESIMEKVERWYDVNVFFQNEGLKEVRFYGDMPRYADIEDLLFFLEKASDARFHVNGRTIVVGNK